jgi:diguanylate cyclase (GGDEF)-like protein
MTVSWPARDRRDPIARQSRDRLAAWLDMKPADLASVPGPSATAMDSLVDAAWYAATNSRNIQPQADQLMLAARSLEDPAHLGSAIGLAYRRRAETILWQVLEEVGRPTRLTLFLATIDSVDAIAAAGGQEASQHLMETAEQRLRAWAQPGTRIERLGEGVFLVIIPELGERQAVKVGDEMAAAVVSSPIVIHGNVHVVTLSIGSASAATTSDANSIVAAADRALDRAARRGGGRIANTKLRPPSPPDRDVTRRFGQRVRQLRLEMGIPVEEMARRSGLHRTYIAGVESGHRHPTLRNIIKLAAGLGRSPADILESV